jgi:hypothetical protein
VIGRPPPHSGYGGGTPPLPTDTPREKKVVALEPSGVIPPLTEGGGGGPRLEKSWPGGRGCLTAWRGGPPPLGFVLKDGASDGSPQETMGRMEELRGGSPPLLREEGVGGSRDHGRGYPPA